MNYWSQDFFDRILQECENMVENIQTIVLENNIENKKIFKTLLTKSKLISLGLRNEHRTFANLEETFLEFE